MKTSRLIPSLLLATAGLAVALAPAARAADESTSTIAFSDPGKPGTVKISLGRGELTVQGADTQEITVKSDAKAVTSKPRKDGLRIISAAASFAMSEKANVVTVDAAGSDFGRGGGNYKLIVPRNTSVVVQNAWGGDINCTNLTGDIEINSMHGEVNLDNVSGGVVVGTMNGEIRANVSELHDGKPLSFTTMNGEVQIRVPEAAKANVRFRTQNGSVLTDFEETALVTKTEASPGFPKRRAFSIGGKNKVLGVEIEETIREATRISATAVKEALEAVKHGLDESRIETDEARRQVEDARRELDKARRDAERAQHDAERTARNAKPAEPALPAEPATPMPPKPGMMPKVATIPTITGGKLVTGTLNGGGPEISVSTMNGDVVLRKLQAK